MAKPKKPKRMTAKEKAARERARKDLRASGVIPPKKKPLNRKKFIKEAREEFNSAELGLMAYPYMVRAIGWVMTDFRPSLEDVGVAKVLKVACEIARFNAELTQAGRTKYMESELYERLKPILDA